MVPAVMVAVLGALVVVAVGFAGVGVTAYRRETFPGRPSFTGYCLLLALTMLGLVGLTAVVFWKEQAASAGLQRTAARLETPARLLTFLAGMLAPLAWLRFVLAYTGQRIPTDRRTLLVVGAPVLVTVGALVVFVGFTLLPLVYDVRQLPAFVVPLVVGGVNYLLTVTGFYVGGLLVAGASLVAWTSHTYRHLSTRGGLLLGVGCILPWLAAAIPAIGQLFEGPQGPLLLTAHAAGGGLLGLVAVGIAVRREGVFESIPAAGTVGRDVTVETMNDPVVVVDTDRRVVDLNPAAARLFDAGVDALGAPLDRLVGASVDPGRLLETDRLEFELAGGQVVEARPSTLVDEYERVLGHSVVFHDITDRKRRQQRIQVLNRVLRHNLRNDMAVVNGHAEALAAMSADLDGHPEQIMATADGLLAIGEKAREIELVVASQHDGTDPLSSVLQQAAATARDAHPDCAFEVDVPAEDVHVRGTVLAAVIEELLANAAEHNDADEPRVVVTATSHDGDDRSVEVTVADNGPGIPDHELTPLREGRETDLEHGSGLGLWLVKWGVAAIDGQLSFDRRDPRGTSVTIQLPRAG